MNSKTNLVRPPRKIRTSPLLYDLEAVLAMRDNGVIIVGLGYTIYLGSEYESTMLAEAGELIAAAHANGLLVVLWIYPRGKAVTAEKDPDLIAGAAGVALMPGRRLREESSRPSRGRRQAHGRRGLKVALHGSRPHGPGFAPAVPPLMPRRS